MPALDDEHTSSREEKHRFELERQRKPTSPSRILGKGLVRVELVRTGGGVPLSADCCCGDDDFTWKLSIFQTLPYMVMFTRLVHSESEVTASSNQLWLQRRDFSAGWRERESFSTTRLARLAGRPEPKDG